MRRNYLSKFKIDLMRPKFLVPNNSVQAALLILFPIPTANPLKNKYILWVAQKTLKLQLCQVKVGARNDIRKLALNLYTKKRLIIPLQNLEMANTSKQGMNQCTD